MIDMRKHKRLAIRLPVRLNVMDGSREIVLDLETRNISYSGTYVSTLTVFPKGTRFLLDFNIPSDNLKEFKNVDSLIGCAGTMVRSDPYGIAIAFDKECQIENLKDL